VFRKCVDSDCLGAFGEVRMCVHRETGAQRAVKVLRKSHMDDDEKKMLFNEINILRELVSRVNISAAIEHIFVFLIFNQKTYLTIYLVLDH
jgi:serine/threonine protein kinase